MTSLLQKWLNSVFPRTDMPGRSTAIAELGPRCEVRDGELMMLLLLTVDRDWREQFDVPPDVSPRFTLPNEVTVGETATALILVSGLTPSEGRLKASCSIDVVTPHGKKQSADEVCLDTPEFIEYAGEQLNQRYMILRASPFVDIVPTNGSIGGTFEVGVHLRDLGSNANVTGRVGVRVMESHAA